MSYITEEHNDTRLAGDLKTFYQAAVENEETLGLDAGQLQDMLNLFDAFTASLQILNDAKALTKSRTVDKNLSKRQARALIAQYSKTWRANPLISDAVLTQLMLPPKQTVPSSLPPATPTDVVATVNNVGEITLRWKRNGNRSGTIFNVESASSPTGPWTVYDATTKATYTFQGTPGTTIWLRVVAKRDGLSAAPTNPLPVWPSSESFALRVAA